MKVDGQDVINEDDKLLITATGTLTCIPHMIGIKRMSKVKFKKDVVVTSLAQIKFEHEAKEREKKRKQRLEQSTGQRSGASRDLGENGQNEENHDNLPGKIIDLIHKY